MKLVKPRASIICHHGKKPDRWLWVRKPDAPWTLPGGKIEPGESPVEAARRELLEETGLEAQSLTLLMRHETPERMHFVFEAEFAEPPQPVPLHEIDALRFAHIDNVSSLKQEMKTLIESLLACDKSIASSLR
ncbi:NUDIX hydrolase [Pseudomonas sp. URMO17WK12:I11]|uniref:NUDIX hydrolase n=1 Tax=Pseudomonas sp. URMO17WK12:I11 TaxID=1283291 RepID=UPI0011A21F29|nr:NUDIX domain-containing protein [Pseudomonas sp. URMO17WK12:I11]